MIEVVDAASKCLKKALSKVNIKLAKVKADWAWKKEVEQEMVDAKNEAAKVVRKFKASEDFGERWLRPCPTSKIQRSSSPSAKILVKSPLRRALIRQSWSFAWLS